MITRLQTKITAAVVAGFLAIAVIFVAIHLTMDRRQISLLKSRADILLETLVERDREPLANELFSSQADAYALRMQKMLRVEGLMGISLFDANGVSIHTEGEVSNDPLTAQDLSLGEGEFITNPEGDQLVGTFPITLIGKTIGYLRVHYSIADILREQSLSHYLIIIQLASLLLVLALVIQVFLQRAIIAPIESLQEGIQKMAAGDDHIKVQVSSTDELGALATAFNHMVIDRQHASSALQAQEARQRTTLDSLLDAVLTIDRQHIVQEVNTSALRLLGLQREEAVGQHVSTVAKMLSIEDKSPWDDKELEHAGREELAHFLLMIPEGDPRLVSATWAPLQGDQQESEGFVLVLRDETEQHRLEERLRHSEKMQALGQLAGGVAHDFNNVLQVISGRSQLLKLRLNDPEEWKKGLDDIGKASARAADLVSKLLSFARRGAVSNQAVDIHRVINDTVEMLQHSIDRRISLDKDFSADTGMVIGDESQLQNALLNLGVNARDAMPQGGRLTFMTKDVVLSSEEALRLSTPVKPGAYVEIKVTDTGSGIGPDILSRIFEPFFTTKSLGEGTGLGLAAVFGTVEAHKGAISAANNPGGGACFRLLIPASDVRPEMDESSTDGIVLSSGGSAHILLIDDEEMLGTLGGEMLKEMGFSPILAANGNEGIRAFQQNHRHLAAVITDLNMPGISGADLVIEFQRLNATVPVFMATGHVDGDTLDKLKSQGLAGILHKPFTIGEMQKILAGTLNPPRT